MARYVIDSFRNAKSDRRYVRGFLCPECDGTIDFSRFEDGKQECPHCRASLRLEVYVDE